MNTYTFHTLNLSLIASSISNRAVSVFREKEQSNSTSGAIARIKCDGVAERMNTPVEGKRL